MADEREEEDNAAADLGLGVASSDLEVDIFSAMEANMVMDETFEEASESSEEYDSSDKSDDEPLEEEHLLLAASSQADVPPAPLDHPPPQPEAIPPWKRQLYVLILFLIGFGGISHRLATVIVRFVSKIFAPRPRHEEERTNSLSARSRNDQPPPHDRILVTPASIRKQIGIKDDFNRYAVCPGCAKLHLWTEDSSLQHSRCDHCREELYTAGRPRLVYAHRSLSMILAAVLQDRKLEDDIEAWRDFLGSRESSSTKTYDTLWSGDSWRGDCLNAACGATCERHHFPFIDGRGHIKISLSIDWFAAHKGSYSGYHSSGAVLMRIDNIPQNLLTVERRCAGIYVIGMLPGPRETKLKELTAYLKLITDELAKLYVDGVCIRTARYPEGKYR